MKFNILISTVDDKFMHRKIDLSVPHIIINQLIKLDESKYSSSIIFTKKEQGLSKSRNRAVEKSSSDICLISDDDLIYKPDLEKIILNAFIENSDADIITFQIETPDGNKFKNYNNKPYWHTIKSLMRVSSVEIAFKRENLINSKLKFDEDFGLGSIYTTGEEGIFLVDALKKGLKILYLPIPIVIHPIESSGGNFKDNTKLIKSKGAMFYRMFGVKAYLISLLFSIKKYKSSNYSLYIFYTLMLDGITLYKVKKNGK